MVAHTYLAERLSHAHSRPDAGMFGSDVRRRLRSVKYRLFAMAVLTATLTRAEHPEIGIRVAWPITTDYRPPVITLGPGASLSSSAGHRAIVGLSIRFPLTNRLALRLTPAWQRVSFDYLYWVSQSSSAAQATTANRWEVPVIAEWRLHEHVRPGVGAAMSRISGDQSWNTAVYTPGIEPPQVRVDRYQVSELSRRTVAGLIADIEFPFRARFGTIAPDLRYTRWASDHFGYRGKLDSFSIGISVRFF